MALGKSLEKLSTVYKLIILFAILVVISLVLIYFLIWPKFNELKQAEEKLKTALEQVKKDEATAAKLPVLQKEYERLEGELKTALTELPIQKEIPGLLTSVTEQGKRAGLDFLLFKPQSEVPKDFYAEVPIEITVSGSYANVGNFFSGVGSLPRIVNISNVAFEEAKSGAYPVNLKVKCKATTFRFTEKKEQKDDKKTK